MKWVITTVYATVLTSLFSMIILAMFLAQVHPAVIALWWCILLYAYARLNLRRVQRAHPEYLDPPPPPEEQHLDSLVSSARPRDDALRHGNPCDCSAHAPCAKPRELSGTPPAGVLGLPVAQPPGPATGSNPTYRISLLNPREEDPLKVLWINEDHMLIALHALYKTYFSRQKVRPRVKIEPTFDLRLANLREKNERKPGWQDRIFDLPKELRSQFIGLLS